MSYTQIVNWISYTVLYSAVVLDISAIGFTVHVLYNFLRFQYFLVSQKKSAVYWPETT